MLNIPQLTLAMLAQSGGHQSGLQEAPGSIPLEVTFLLNLFCSSLCKPLFPTFEFFTVCTKLAEMALLYSKELATAKKSYLQWGLT